MKSAQPHSNFSEPNGNSADIRIILFPMAVRRPFSMRNYIDTSSQAFMYTRRERCYLYDGPPVKSQPRFSITGPFLAAKGISGAHTTPRHNKQFVEALYFQQLRPCRAKQAAATRWPAPYTACMEPITARLTPTMLRSGLLVVVAGVRVWPTMVRRRCMLSRRVRLTKVLVRTGAQ